MKHSCISSLGLLCFFFPVIYVGKSKVSAKFARGTLEFVHTNIHWEIRRSPKYIATTYRDTVAGFVLPLGYASCIVDILWLLATWQPGPCGLVVVCVYTLLYVWMWKEFSFPFPLGIVLVILSSRLPTLPQPGASFQWLLLGMLWDCTGDVFTFFLMNNSKIIDLRKRLMFTPKIWLNATNFLVKSVWTVTTGLASSTLEHSAWGKADRSTSHF